MARIPKPRLYKNDERLIKGVVKIKVTVCKNSKFGTSVCPSAATNDLLDELPQPAMKFSTVRALHFLFALSTLEVSTELQDFVDNIVSEVL